jgi:hypothetical protein
MDWRAMISVGHFINLQNDKLEYHLILQEDGSLEWFDVKKQQYSDSGQDDNQLILQAITDQILIQSWTVTWFLNDPLEILS